LAIIKQQREEAAKQRELKKKEQEAKAKKWKWFCRDKSKCSSINKMFPFNVIKFVLYI
jgi:hypothetical protein